MKILLSVFAMGPGRGSEPGVAWNWALGLAELGHQVLVLTSSRNREAIEAAAPLDSSLEFLFIDLLGTRKIPFGTPGHYVYYYIWQIWALIILIRTRSWQSVDIIHHLTYGGVRAGSVLWLLPKRFLIGPIGGGETCPLRLVRPLGTRALLKEFSRHLVNALARVSPLFILAQWRAERIVCKTEQTRNLIAPFFRQKATVSIEIGAAADKFEKTNQQIAENNERTFDVLFAGRMIYWKGYSIAYEAIQLARRSIPNLSAVFVGDGPELASMKSLVPKIDSNTSVIGKLPQAALFSIYQDSKLFLFPSLHDSSGNVVLESMLFGVPVICLDLGGPPLIVKDTGVVVPVDSRSYDAVVAHLADAVVRLLADTTAREEFSAKAGSRARGLTWQNAILGTYHGLPGFH